ENQDKVRKVFKGVLYFLTSQLERDPAQYKNMTFIRGIYAMMSFVMEAAVQIEKNSILFKESPALQSISDLQELRNLQEYYVSAILPRLPPPAEMEGIWEIEWGVKDLDLSDLKSGGLRSLEEIRKDTQYELFYVLNEQGRPFYEYDILRHARLIYDFDELQRLKASKDIFEKIEIFRDKEAYMVASQMLKHTHDLVDEFFKEALRHTESECIAHLSHAIMALMLSANARNLKQTSVSEKTSLGYFKDFQLFIRKALQSEEYQRLLQSPNSSRPLQANLYLLIHKLCFIYFTHTVEHKEIIAILRRILSEGSQEIGLNQNSSSIIAALKQEDLALRHRMKKYPAGAIHKMAEVFTDRQHSKGFDPLSQGYVPEIIYSLHLDGRSAFCLRMPCPIMQEFIQKAHLAPEFVGMLRFLSLRDTKQKILLVNLQNRTSWQEFARCIAIEELARNQDERDRVSLLGLATHTDFYWQEGTFASIHEAEVFISQFKEQFHEMEECGFYLSEDLAQPIRSYVHQILPRVHKVFFQSKNTLSKEDRQNFIELTYWLISLEALRISKADFISYFDKDSVDGAACMQAGCFAALELMHDHFGEQQVGQFLYLLYASAIEQRERTPDPRGTDRMLGALTCFEAAYQDSQADTREIFFHLRIGSVEA
ncbi:MAG: hypothetical protein EBZ47_07850, partial [Chlamydiae bacterium]|nr:hypothetical protein [Chlamydiota bacterium]